jgi:Domain of unknown function (DUF4082)/Bacterial Ig domain
VPCPQLGTGFERCESFVSINALVTGLRFYKGPQNTGTHAGHLWRDDGTLLATVTFTDETANGWQHVDLDEPVAISPGDTYVASYHAPKGRYSVTEGYFGSSYTNGPLTAPRTGQRGVLLRLIRLLPTKTHRRSNYWVDVVFDDAPADANRPPVATYDGPFRTPLDNDIELLASDLLANDTVPEGGTLTVTSVQDPIHGSVSLDGDAITFELESGYDGAEAGFAYTVADTDGATSTARVAIAVERTGGRFFRAR